MPRPRAHPMLDQSAVVNTKTTGHHTAPHIAIPKPPLEPYISRSSSSTSSFLPARCESRAVLVVSMGTPELAGAYGSFAPLAVDRLRRQRSLPAAVAAVFAPCTGGGEARRKHGSARLGGKVGHRDGHDGEEVEYFRRRVPPAWQGGAGFVRALWMRVVRKVMSRSRSLSKKQYGLEDYAWNFDEGAAAGEEPDNLPRSFSARYARRRPVGRPLPDVPHAPSASFAFN